MKNSRRSWTDEDLIIAAKESTSIRSILKKLNLEPAGGNYAIVKKYMKQLNIDTSHLTGKGWNRGKTYPVTKESLEALLVDNKETNTYSLKNKLIKAKILEEICSNCGLDKWLENKIPLEMDHINGKRTDNRIENLRLLCPNCHAQTETYRGKNKKKPQ